MQMRGSIAPMRWNGSCELVMCPEGRMQKVSDVYVAMQLMKALSINETILAKCNKVNYAGKTCAKKNMRIV
jgi:hypothetical protein